MRKGTPSYFPILFFIIVVSIVVNDQTNDKIYYVKRTADFEITRKGISESWERATWLRLSPRGESSALQTQVKVLYSDTGIFLLFDSQDRKITASTQEDFGDLWKEDAVEVFLWTDEDFPIYFEYQLSPLNRELVLLVPNLKGQYLGWRPRHYEKKRLTRHEVWIDSTFDRNKKKKIRWLAKIYIPYALLRPLGNVPPKSGTRWRVNLYRCDYDLGYFESWAWQPVKEGFHEFRKFGTFIFQ